MLNEETNYRQVVKVKSHYVETGENETGQTFQYKEPDDDEEIKPHDLTKRRESLRRLSNDTYDIFAKVFT